MLDRHVETDDCDTRRRLSHESFCYESEGREDTRHPLIQSPAQSMTDTGEWLSRGNKPRIILRLIKAAAETAATALAGPAATESAKTPRRRPAGWVPDCRVSPPAAAAAPSAAAADSVPFVQYGARIPGVSECAPHPCDGWNNHDNHELIHDCCESNDAHSHGLLQWSPQTLPPLQ